MKLLRAKFENFRLLRNLSLDFSTDNVQNLTVIRAENETGKTTILNALQWALYGDEVLPDERKKHRLSPIDWEPRDNTRVRVSVEIDFETTSSKTNRRGKSTEITRHYRIIRSTFEVLNGPKHTREPAMVQLFQITNEGVERIDPPEAEIQNILPPELRELFFTDSDRALRFIEAIAEAKTKRERVEQAIKSLLGLGVIEAALSHIAITVRERRKDIGKFVVDEQIQDIRTKIAQIDENIVTCERDRDDAELQVDRLNQSLSDIDTKIEETLIRGDRETLVQDLQETQTRLEKMNEELRAAHKAHSKLFESMPLSRDLTAPVLERSLEKLAELHSQGQLPRTAVPVLEEHLRRTVCICGESLNPDDPACNYRREHIQQLIETNKTADDLQRSLTDLYYSSRILQSPKIEDSDHWVAHYARIADQIDELEEQQNGPAKELRALEIQIENTPDTNLQGLRASKQQRIEQRDNFIIKHTECQSRLEVLKDNMNSLVATMNNLTRHYSKEQRVQATLQVAEDVQSVLEESKKQITDQEVRRVSRLMNDLFLEMIGADQEQKAKAIIQRVDISPEFDICVYGTKDVVLDPDLDLNGASRRALTLAFIMALTKVSRVEAPNVIDTPLGMMSGFVRRRVLSTVVRESSQLILFLTRSEIRECEDILDTSASKVITLTNTTHYPNRLINDPGTTEKKVLRCECNHRSECKLCKQRVDVDQNTEA